jgi:hypothetical protein
VSAHLRGPEAVHDAECGAYQPLGRFAYSVNMPACTCRAFLQQRILDEFWNSELPSVKKVKRLCKLVDLIPEQGELL